LILISKRYYSLCDTRTYIVDSFEVGISIEVGTELEVGKIKTHQELLMLEVHKDKKTSRVEVREALIKREEAEEN
jgi:hypothetical protein